MHFICCGDNCCAGKFNTLLAEVEPSSLMTNAISIYSMRSLFYF